MPRQERVYRIFVASPGDVAPERSLLSDVIASLSSLWQSRGVSLRLVRWETDAYPSVGADAQDVINTELSDDYDVYVGIMWTRFGTPTNRSGSGTAEEFHRAYTKWSGDPSRMRILFYFRDAPMAPSLIDPEQLAGVKGFRRELEGLGVLHWAYTAPDEFASYLLLHLNKAIEDLESMVTADSIAASSTPDLIDVPDTLDKRGELKQLRADVLAVHPLIKAEQAAFTMLAESLGSFLPRLGELLKLERATRQTDNVRTLEVGDELAAELLTLVTRLEQNAPSLISTQAASLDAQAKLITALAKYSELRKQATGLVDATVSHGEAYQRFTTVVNSVRDRVDAIPSTTPNLVAAKARALDALDRLQRQSLSAAQKAIAFQSLLTPRTTDVTPPSSPATTLPSA